MVFASLLHWLSATWLAINCPSIASSYIFCSGLCFSSENTFWIIFLVSNRLFSPFGRCCLVCGSSILKWPIPLFWYSPICTWVLSRLWGGIHLRSACFRVFWVVGGLVFAYGNPFRGSSWRLASFCVAGVVSVVDSDWPFAFLFYSPWVGFCHVMNVSRFLLCGLMRPSTVIQHDVVPCFPCKKDLHWNALSVAEVEPEFWRIRALPGNVVLLALWTTAVAPSFQPCACVYCLLLEVSIRLTVISRLVDWRFSDFLFALSCIAICSISVHAACRVHWEVTSYVRVCGVPSFSLQQNACMVCQIEGGRLSMNVPFSTYSSLNCRLLSLFL